MQFFRRLWLARPSPTEAFLSGLIWGTVMVACLWVDYFLSRQMLPPPILELTLVYGFGAFFAAPLALWLTGIFKQSTTISHFAAAMVVLGLLTVGFTALLFAFDFWLYFSRWHASTFSKIWAIQFVFTFGSAIYQFLVSGLRLYVPFGLVALIIASFWASRRNTR